MNSGYQWWKSQKIGTSSILKVDPKNKFTVLGTSIPAKKVDNIWVVESKTNTMPGSAMDLAKMRMKLRASPSYASFDHYVKIRTSCWIIEEADGEFYCDCPIGMKVRILITYKFITIYLLIGKA